MMPVVRLWQRAWLQVLAIVGRDAAALRLCDRLLAHSPADRRARALRMHGRARGGNLAGALEDSALLTQHALATADDWFNHGFLLEASGACLPALDAFESALRLQPALDRAWYGMGLALRRLGRPDDALAAFKRNTELQPMSPHGWYQMALLQAQQQQAQSAIDTIRHLRTFEPRVARQLSRETGLSA